MSFSPGKVHHMKALSDKNGIIAAAAMDQRGSLQKAIASAKGVPTDQVTSAMMEEFKVTVAKILTPHASAILLDPEYGLPAAKARASNAGLLLAYEESGYDNTMPGQRRPLLPGVRDLRSQGGRREGLGVRQAEAQAGNGRHGGVFQTAVRRG